MGDEAKPIEDVLDEIAREVPESEWAKLDEPTPNPREITPERLAEILVLASRTKPGYMACNPTDVVDLCDALAESWAKANRLRGENDRLVARIMEIGGY